MSELLWRLFEILKTGFGKDSEAFRLFSLSFISGTFHTSLKARAIRGPDFPSL
jgi:hypothetical protein